MITDFMRGFDAIRFVRERLGFHPDRMQQIVLCPGIRRGLLNCSRQWSKSTVTAAKAVHCAWSNPESLVLVASPGMRQTEEFLRKSSAFVRRLGLPVRGDGSNPHSLQFPNGSRIVGIPGTPDTVRGFSAVSLMLIDEAAWVSDELYQAVGPMLAVSDGDLWLISTPNGPRGFFYEEWTNGGDVWTRVRVPASQFNRIPRRFLDEQRASIGERAFSQEYECEFVGAEGSLFHLDTVRRAIDPQLKALELEERW